MSDQQFFAKLDDQNVVIIVAVTTSEFMAENPERYPGTWVETFYDKPGKTYAGLGYIYDWDKQDFTPPPPPPDELGA